MTCRSERSHLGDSRSGRGLAPRKRLGGTIINCPRGEGGLGLRANAEFHIVVGMSVRVIVCR